jgi:hypothetical protein
MVQVGMVCVWWLGVASSPSVANTRIVVMRSRDKDEDDVKEST